MARPILNYSDPRVQKLQRTHACICRRKYPDGKIVYMWFNLDNLPDRDIWQRLGVARVAISGKTISEAIFMYNEAMKNVRITGRTKPLRRKVRS